MNCAKCGQPMTATIADGYGIPIWLCPGCGTGQRRDITEPVAGTKDTCKQASQAQIRTHRIPRSGKYNAVRTEYNGHLYASKAEAKRAQELTILKQAGEVSYWLEQVPFRLKCGAVYRVDFFVVWADGHITIEDPKGMKTAVYKLKKKMVESEYPVRIVEL